MTGISQANPQPGVVSNTSGVLNGVANPTFSYDANGNQNGTGFTTTTGNEQTSSPGYTYTYDAAGNMITATQTSTGDVWTYGYNFAGQMTSAVEKNSSGTILGGVPGKLNGHPNSRQHNELQNAVRRGGSHCLVVTYGERSIAL